MPHPLRFSDMDKPHLWPPADLKMARSECRQRLKDHRTTPTVYTETVQQLAEIEKQLTLKTGKRP